MSEIFVHSPLLMHAMKSLFDEYKSKAVIEKNWVRFAVILSGIEASSRAGSTTEAGLEAEILKVYMGDNRAPTEYPGVVNLLFAGTLPRLELLESKFGITFNGNKNFKLEPKDFTEGKTGHWLWRNYKDFRGELSNDIIPVYSTCLNADGEKPSGSNDLELIKSTLKKLYEGKKGIEESPTVVLASPTPTKSPPKPYVFGEYLHICFLPFLALGPPAGKDCFHHFSLEKKTDGSGPKSKREREEETNRDSLKSPKFMKQEAVKKMNQDINSFMQKRISSDEKELAVLAIEAETNRRAQRMRELDLALKIFPDREKEIKEEFADFFFTKEKSK